MRVHLGLLFWTIIVAYTVKDVKQKGQGDESGVKSELDVLYDVTTNTVNLLRENSHLELALAYALRSLAVCFQHQSITQLQQKRLQVVKRQQVTQRQHVAGVNRYM